MAHTKRKQRYHTPLWLLPYSKQRANKKRHSHEGDRSELYAMDIEAYQHNWLLLTLLMAALVVMVVAVMVMRLRQARWGLAEAQLVWR